MFLKTKGIDPKTHPIKDEMARIQRYMQKIKEKQQSEEGMHYKIVSLADKFRKK